MAELKTYLSQSGINQIGMPELNDGRAEALQSFSQQLQSFNQFWTKIYGHAKTWQDKTAVEEGEKQAQAMVADAIAHGGQFSPNENRRGLFWERYNAVGIAAQASILQADIDEHVANAAAQHPYDAEAFDEKIAEYRERLNDVTHPTMRNLTTIELKKSAGRARASITAASTKRAYEANQSEILRGVRDLGRQMLNAARRGDAEGAVMLRQEAADRIGVMESYYGLAPGKAESMRYELERSMLMEGAKGDFDRALYGNRGMSHIREFRQNEDETFSPDEREQLLSYMEGRWSRQHAEMAQSDAQQERNMRQIRQAEGERATQIVWSPGVDVEEKLKYLENRMGHGLLDRSVYADLRKDIETRLMDGQGDPRVLKPMDQMINAFVLTRDDVEAAFTYGRITRPQYNDYIGKLWDQDTSKHPMQTVTARQGLQAVTDSILPSGNFFSKMTDEGMRLANARIDYARMVIENAQRGYPIDELALAEKVITLYGPKNESIEKHLPKPYSMNQEEVFDEYHRKFQDDGPEAQGWLRRQYELMEAWDKRGAQQAVPITRDESIDLISR